MHLRRDDETPVSWIRTTCALLGAAIVAAVVLVPASPAQAWYSNIYPVCGPAGEPGWTAKTFTGHNPPNSIDINRNYLETGDSGRIVVASGAGVIRAIKRPDSGGYGTTVLIQGDDGIWTFYAHLAATYGSVGSRIAQGTRVGQIGQTGGQPSTHLHYEQRTSAYGAPRVPVLQGRTFSANETRSFTPSVTC